MSLHLNPSFKGNQQDIFVTQCASTLSPHMEFTDPLYIVLGHKHTVTNNIYAKHLQQISTNLHYGNGNGKWLVIRPNVASCSSLEMKIH